MKNYLYFACLVIFVSSLIGCKDDDPAQVLSGDRLITSFTFETFTPPVEGTINNTDGVINITIPFGTNVTSLAPAIEVSEGATISPASGEPQDFSKFVIYTVTAANGAKKVYTVLAEMGASNVARITAIDFASLYHTVNANQQAKEVVIDVPFGTNVSQITVNVTTAEAGSTTEPASGATVDFSQPVAFVVTAPDGVTQETYTARMNVQPQETGIRGVWLTNVDSDVLNSKDKIIAAVALCKELNINTIFVVTYNKAATSFPSQVMDDLIGRPIDPLYTGRDPLREIIDAAHAENIKVFAWFEYGFAAFNGSPGPILQAKPAWGAINSSGNQVVKNGFYWLNSMLPEVQNFMTDLVMEVVNNYPDIDGIQGDDRLPAMPTEGGYDAYTVAEYKAAHNGAAPPTDRTDDAWVQWRANRLNVYAEQLYARIKAANPNCLVAMSPSPLTFGLREYLQDYTSWVSGGYCDIVSPQLYRRDNQGIAVYAGLLEDQLNRVGASNKDIFYPGLLSYLGGYVPDERFLVNMIRENRKRGVTGEVHFFYNALLAQKNVFKVIYPAPAIFPVIN